MSADYMEALRVQLELLDRARRLQGRGEEAFAVEAALLQAATPIFLAPWVQRALEEAYTTLPADVRLREDQLPCRSGFVLLNDGPLMRVSEAASWRHLEAIAWSADFGSDVAILLTGHDYHEDALGMVFAFWLDESGAAPHLCRWGSVAKWAFGAPAPSFSTHDPQTLSDFGRFALTLWSFMAEKRVTSVSGREFTGPAAIRARQRNWTHDPIVQVVELRAAEPRPQRDGEHQAVDWSCRWAVRGHWHKYHYGDGTLRARWVAAYVKGPAGRPLRAATKLLAVVR